MKTLVTLKVEMSNDRCFIVITVIRNYIVFVLIEKKKRRLLCHFLAVAPVIKVVA